MIELKRVTDTEELLVWREEVIRNVFGIEPTPSLMEENRNYYLRHISDGSHIALKALYGSEEAGCGSLCLSEELPSPDNPNGKCGYLMNIYVRDKFREKGVGHALVARLVELAKENDCDKIYLETTTEGRGLYRTSGFKDLPDMMKYSEKDGQ